MLTNVNCWPNTLHLAYPSFPLRFVFGGKEARPGHPCLTPLDSLKGLVQKPLFIMELSGLVNTVIKIKGTVASLFTRVQYCRIDSIRQNYILFVVDRKIAFHWRRRCGQSAVDSIDSFDLSNGKVYYRFDKCGRRSDNCISLVTTATRYKIVESIDSFDWWEWLFKFHSRFYIKSLSNRRIHLNDD